MELKVSSPKPSGLSPSDSESHPQEKEISDEDDDDRNHKHRRRETRSQSLERDALGQFLSRPYRNLNKSFENGHSFRENDSQSSGSWKNYSTSPMEKDFSGKLEKRRPGLATFGRAPLDLNQRTRMNQSFLGDPSPFRGRGRDPSSWNQRDSRFSHIDIASQMVQHGSIPPGLYAARGLPNVSSSQNPSWSGFGLLPGIPNGALDSLHSLGLQGTLRPPLITTLNKSIPRQRCRDFEERGFCLRGDMCPMEHGVNRIVVEDVQSLSQFNLPVSLPSAHLLGTPGGPGALPSANAPPSTLINSKGFQSKNGKPEVAEDELGLNGAFSGSNAGGGAELYDPDQPLWNNDCPEAPSVLSVQQSPKIDETECLLEANSSERYHARLSDGTDNGRRLKSTGTTVGSQNTNVSVWGRINSAKDRSEAKERIDSVISPSDYLENEGKEDRDALTSVQGTSHQGKQTVVEGIGPKNVHSSSRTQGDALRNIRKPSQKALRTLFVNGIPQNNNRKDPLLSHFQKFGEVIDIYIPLNSERAFVQFSKREEAEAALQAPDAVMGNRFIKLWWANRDSVPDVSVGSGNGASVTPHGLTAASVPSHPSALNRTKENLQSVAQKVNAVPAIDAPSPTSDHSKTIVTNGPKAPPLQKKLESLELMKEELRKKQEMLDQKRNDFRRQLDKLEKQATGVKSEVGSEQAAKRHKVGMVGDAAKASTARCTDPGIAVGSSQIEIATEKNKSAESAVPPNSKTTTALQLLEPSFLKQSVRPLATLAGTPPQMNRYKLDNRPTGFRIMAPLPAGLANVAILREHFSSYGDLSAVELEDLESHNDGNDSDASGNHSARIIFTTRHSAERAFVNGKCWRGHNLQIMWLTSNNSGNELSGQESSPSASKGSSDANLQPAQKVACNVSLETALSGNGEPEDSERESCMEHKETEGNFQASSTLLSEQSPKGNVC